jgi:hypothetical protein
MEIDQVQLLNKIMQLEKDIVSREKENKLLHMKLREVNDVTLSRNSSPQRLR